MPNIFDKVFKKNNQSDVIRNNSSDLGNKNTNINMLSKSENKLLKDIDKQYGEEIKRFNEKQRTTGPKIPRRNESLPNVPGGNEIQANLEDGVTLSANAAQFGTFNRNQSSKQNQGQSNEANNTQPSPSQTGRDGENSYYSDKNSIAKSTSQESNLNKGQNRGSISVDTFGNGRPSTKTIINNMSSGIDLNNLNNLQRSNTYPAKDSNNRQSDKQKQAINRSNSANNLTIARRNKM